MVRRLLVVEATDVEELDDGASGSQACGMRAERAHAAAYPLHDRGLSGGQRLLRLAGKLTSASGAHRGGGALVQSECALADTMKAIIPSQRPPVEILRIESASPNRRGEPRVG